MERETGFEPATDGLGSRCATPAPLPLCVENYRVISVESSGEAPTPLYSAVMVSPSATATTLPVNASTTGSADSFPFAGLGMVSSSENMRRGISFELAHTLAGGSRTGATVASRSAPSLRA